MERGTIFIPKLQYSKISTSRGPLPEVLDPTDVLNTGQNKGYIINIGRASCSAPGSLRRAGNEVFAAHGGR